MEVCDDWKDFNERVGGGGVGVIKASEGKFGGEAAVNFTIHIRARLGGTRILQHGYKDNIHDLMGRTAESSPFQDGRTDIGANSNFPNAPFWRPARYTPTRTLSATGLKSAPSYVGTVLREWQFCILRTVLVGVAPKRVLLMVVLNLGGSTSDKSSWKLKVADKVLLLSLFRIPLVWTLEGCSRPASNFRNRSLFQTR